MKKLIVLAGIFLSLSASANIVTMPSVDWDALEKKAQTVALESAQNFSGSEDVKIREIGSGLLSTNYFATAGDCTFVVKVGFAFRTAISNIQNCK